MALKTSGIIEIRGKHMRGDPQPINIDQPVYVKTHNASNQPINIDQPVYIKTHNASNQVL
jgi:hypothetical protein